MSYTFFPPSVEEHYWDSFIEDDDFAPFRRRFTWPQGISVIRDGASFSNKRFFLPDPDWVEGEDYFVGGHHYVVSDDIALELIAAGYSPLPVE